MFQLTMSLIHDEAHAQRYDSDSHVHGIPDFATGVEAFTAYVVSLRESYGVEFTFGQVNEGTPMAMWANFTSSYGPATLYVELQRMNPQTDVEGIVRLMRVNARQTNVTF